jgi:GT2 family glycosyltransferase
MIGPTSRPLLSIVIPVRGGAGLLRESLAALALSDLPRAMWELIVVSDNADSDCEEVAAGLANLLIRLPAPCRGPAYARNRGAELARGAILLFLHADIRVRPETLSRVVDTFRKDPAASAVFGSYDASPPAPGLISQYHNLLRHYQHQRFAGEVAAFWAGCGAVLRDAFMGAGMFDEWRFCRPESEDIDLGLRLRAQGHRVIFDRSLLVTHLKQWTLTSSLVSVLRDRGLSFMRTVGGDEGAAGVSTPLWLRSARTSATCTGVAALLALGSVITHSGRLLQGAALLLVLALAVQAPLFGFLIRARGAPFGVVAVPVHVMHDLFNATGLWIGWILRHVVGDPHRDPLTEAYAELGLQTWPPVPRRVPSGMTVSYEPQVSLAAESGSENDLGWGATK